jgi:perosamine synthetase
MVRNTTVANERVIPLARPSYGREEEEAVAEVLRSGWVAQGPTTAAFEEEFARAVGAQHAIATSSCTTALHLAVIAAGVGPGDEVVLPSYTFPATANAVLYEGGVPVLADIERDTLNLDPEDAIRAVTPRTKAIIGVHLFGCPCRIEELERICAERGIFLIEDAACAIGTRTRTREAGAAGNIACFSFHARKVVSTGEGGMLTTNDRSVAELVASLRTHGADRAADVRQKEGAAPSAAHYVRLGYNYRLSDIQSAVGRVQLRRLPELLAERERLARRYDDALSNLPGLRLPPRRVEGRHSYQSYVVVVEDSAPITAGRLMSDLASRGISTRVGTYAVHLQPYFLERFPRLRPLPVSEEAAHRAVALPLYNGLPEPDQDRVVEALHTIFKSSR